MLKRAKRGLTLVEILIGLAIIATLAAVLYPSVGGQLRRGESTAIGNQLKALSQAIAAFRENVQRYPSTLTQLTTQPGAGAVDLCTNVIPAVNRAAWRGPYLAQNIQSNFPVGDATVVNALTRVVTAAPAGLLQITVQNVDTVAVADIERQIDGTPLDYTIGTILWTSVTQPTGNLRYQIPMRC